jgi:hypothetical protein
VAALLFVVLGGVSSAQTRNEQAKREFQLGKAAYERGDFQTAYDAFKRSYIMSQQPALLYNISSAQQGLGRPHEAAETLRDYLKAVPQDPERADIEKRIAALEEANWLILREQEAKAREEDMQRKSVRANLDAAERKKVDEELVRLRRERELESARLRDQMRASELRLMEERERLKETELRLTRERNEQQFLLRGLESQHAEERRRRRNIAIGVSIAGVIIVGTAVGLAVGLTRPIEHTPADIGPITATP